MLVWGGALRGCWVLAVSLVVEIRLFECSPAWTELLRYRKNGLELRNGYALGPLFCLVMCGFYMVIRRGVGHASRQPRGAGAVMCSRDVFGVAPRSQASAGKDIYVRNKVASPRCCSFFDSLRNRIRRQCSGKASSLQFVKSKPTFDYVIAICQVLGARVVPLNP